MANTWGSLNAANNSVQWQVFAGQGANSNGQIFFANDQSSFIATNTMVGAVGSIVSGVRVSTIGVNSQQTGNIAMLAVGQLPSGYIPNAANNSTIESASHAVHSGWQNRTEFTGPVVGVTLVTPGAGVNTAGFLIVGGNTSGSGANVSFTTVNLVNTAQTYSTNSQQNGVGTVVLVTGGSLYNVAPTSANVNGGLASVTLLTGGQGVNAAGFIVFAGSGGGSSLNVSYTIANSQNTLQGSSTNAYLNAISSIVVNNYGNQFWNNTGTFTLSSGTPITAPTLSLVLAGGVPTTLPTFTFTVGGRAGRVQYETLVTMANIV